MTLEPRIRKAIYADSGIDGRKRKKTGFLPHPMHLGSKVAGIGSKRRKQVAIEANSAGIDDARRKSEIKQW